MSADNGIYILETTDGYRVAHLQAVNNVDYGVRRRATEAENDDIRIKNARMMWDKAPFFREKEMARQYAFKLEERHQLLEYGICWIKIPRNFNEEEREMSDKVEKLEKALEFARNEGEILDDFKAFARDALKKGTWVSEVLAGHAVEQGDEIAVIDVYGDLFYGKIDGQEDDDDGDLQSRLVYFNANGDEETYLVSKGGCGFVKLITANSG
jgi:hypothetical protein